MLTFAALACATSASLGEAADDELSVRGIVDATHKAELSTDIFFPIADLPFREGEAFKKGDLLIGFDCRDLDAMLKAAQAVLSAETIAHKNLKRLAKMNAAGDFEVDMQQAKLDQAAAEVEGLDAKVARCTISAPFDGRIAELHVRKHEFPDQGQPLMHIVGQTDLQIDLLLPAIWLRWLKPEMTFQIHIEEADVSLAAKVARISPVVDPVSQTTRVTATFVDPTGEILPGMSGPAHFEVPQSQ